MCTEYGLLGGGSIPGGDLHWYTAWPGFFFHLAGFLGFVASFFVFLGTFFSFDLCFVF